MNEIKHLFQQEFSKMVAVISRRFGLPQIEIAEDIVSETFLLAAETWGVKGLPENPTAWLYTVAKQKTLYYFRRNKIFEKKIAPELQATSGTSEDFPELDFSQQNIKDSQLQMMFAICDPSIASEAQIGLALRILCGFGIDEIAEAFLSNKETINKRLFRAKEKLRAENIEMKFPAENEIRGRLDSVLRIIYLLFSEGYYSKTQNQILRKEFCFEALRLALLLADFPGTALPKTYALIALMCFHASRFDARKTNDNSLVLHEEQDSNLWDQELINRGIDYLSLSAEGNELSSYHLEARIAYWHCVKDDTEQKWNEILHLYDQLLLVNPSPSVALNRTFALYKAQGPQVALAEFQKLPQQENHFYFVLLGELYKSIDPTKAKTTFQKAHSLARTQSEKQLIEKKISELKCCS
jgi:RNA polymerase sigma factor (sigma-70 family)